MYLRYAKSAIITFQIFNTCLLSLLSCLCIGLGRTLWSAAALAGGASRVASMSAWRILTYAERTIAEGNGKYTSSTLSIHISLRKHTQCVIVFYCIKVILMFCFCCFFFLLFCFSGFVLILIEFFFIERLSQRKRHCRRSSRLCAQVWR